MAYKELVKDKDGNIDMEALKKDEVRLEALDKVHRYIVQKLKENLYPPTLKEIARDLFMSVSSVHHHVRDLVELGLIEMPKYNVPHTMKVKGFQVNRMGVPLCALCGGELTFLNNNIVTNKAITEEEYQCPHCGSYARFTLLDDKDKE